MGDNRMVIGWKEAIVLSLLGFIISLPCFLVYEVIWGDLLGGILVPLYNIGVYTRIDIALFLGFLIVLTISMIINVVLYRQYHYWEKIRANLYAILITIVILYIISFLFMFYLFPNASIFYILMMFPFYLVFFTVYVLHSPILFWIIAMGIYHVSLIFLYKMILTRKISTINNKKNKGYISRVL